MKNKVKYSAGTTLMVLLCCYSACHPEKYHVLIPVIFGTIAVLGITLLITDRK